MIDPTQSQISYIISVLEQARGKILGMSFPLMCDEKEYFALRTTLLKLIYEFKDRERCIFEGLKMLQEIEKEKASKNE